MTTTVWQLDPSHCTVEFAVRHLMISTVRGRFGDVKGTVTTEGDDFRTAQVDVTIGVASIDTREPQRDDHLRSADFFDVAKYPTITFKSRRVEGPEKGPFRVVGDLTMHGVTREVVLDVTLEGAGKDPWGNYRAGFSAKTTLNRKDFGLAWNQLLEAGGVVVGDEVKVSIDAELVKQVATAAAA
ncbi:MAG: YceI family protein [Gemmatimonadota bacterium]